MVPSFRVDTGTICAFPSIWPSGALDRNISLAVAADCTVAYSERLGAGYYAMQCAALIVPMFSLAVLLWQLLALKRFMKHKSSYYRLRDNAAFGFFVCAIGFNVCLVIDSIDLFNFHGMYPVEFYALWTELVACFLVAVAVLLVDFWVRCAKLRSKVGFPPAQLAALLVLVGLNFVGWTVVAIIDVAHYRAYEGIKSLGGGVLLCGFFVKAVFTVRALRDSLNASDHGKRAVRVLVRKFAYFSVVLLFAVGLLVVNAIVVLSTAAETDEWHWKVDFFLQPDPLLYLLRVLYLMGSVACMLFFRVSNSPSSNHVENHVENENELKLSPVATRELASRELSPFATRTE